MNLKKRVKLLTNNTEIPYTFMSLFYGHKNRYYHTLEHIKQCLTTFDKIHKQFTNPREAELAIYFHDIIYNTHSDNNEEQSATITQYILSLISCRPKVIDKVKSLILATKHDTKQLDNDHCLIADIDLCILAVGNTQYWEYVRKIRLEYGWLSQNDFNRGRSKLLKKFLNKDRIYQSYYFHKILEKRARNNICNELISYEGY